MKRSECYPGSLSIRNEFNSIQEQIEKWRKAAIVKRRLVRDHDKVLADARRTAMIVALGDPQIVARMVKSTSCAP